MADVPSKVAIYKDIGNGLASAGLEYYLPLFFDKTATLFDYLSPQAALCLHGDIGKVLEGFWSDLRDRHRLICADRSRPVLDPQDLYLNQEQFFHNAQPWPQLTLRPEKIAEDLSVLPQVTIDRRKAEPLSPLQQLLSDSAQNRTLLLAESNGRRETLLELLAEHGVRPQRVETWQQFQQGEVRLGIAVGPLAAGFVCKPEQINLITETELFAQTPAVRRRRKQEQTSNIDTLIKDLAELNVGDPVVHTQHGIGRYQGLVELDLGGSSGEFLHLRYANDASLYVPVAQLQHIQRYTGVSADEAPLHTLGSGQWEKARRKAAEQVRDTAAELLNIYARRASRSGHAFRYSPSDYERFAAGFGFEETPDQLAAIHAVTQDMISPRPMDRLVCGDVGFGKTEVALRAAFLGVLDGKQVAVLAPTTLLAEQHCDTFRDRFADWPVRIAEFSRFRSAKEIKQGLQGLREGRVDIAIGTHKLLGSDVVFKNLGLVIIDEEHRFGVRHKEVMKSLRAEVDVLTLTATPIPRTMGMALEGIRDLSVIATAPQKRLAIKTFVRAEDKSTIREAVLREINRGGQVYFLHNEVVSIEKRAQSLRELIPQARIAVAHGQMPERQLEHVMREFINQQHNILVCSTIIETGIDVPSANTIVISGADNFGLAQLHQLRGRVGRSHHQAYAYLLVPDISSLTKPARMRLEAITSMEELGSGFYLAMHDLEIRGAGEVLGESQSGNIMAIGYQLYSDMLAEAVNALKSGREPDMNNPLGVSVEINLHAPALLPSDYCPDTHIRLSMYKKLASCTQQDQITSLGEDLIDRFGRLPDATHTLLDVHRLRIQAKPIGLKKIDAGEEAIVLHFAAHNKVDHAKLLALLQGSKDIRLIGQDKIRVNRALPVRQQRVQCISDIIRTLTP